MPLRSQLERLLSVHQADALSADVLVRDDDEELTWHSFLGHHDFWRFRGDLFFLHGRGRFVALRKREPPLGVEFLTTLWRQLERSNPDRLRGRALLARYDWRNNPDHTKSLRDDLAHGGKEGPEYLAIWDDFRQGVAKWYALVLFDAAVLADRFSSSFRTYLERTCDQLTAGRSEFGLFPKLRWKATLRRDRNREVSLEDALAVQITHDFAVGIEVARYLFCDWLLAFWHDDHAALFDSFKHDQNAENFGKNYGWYANREQFLELCHRLCPDLPPRVVNECIWLHQNQGCRCLGDVPAGPHTVRRAKCRRERSAPTAGSASVEVFVDADDAYLDWLGNHPHGFVLNCDRRPKPSYLVLHRARCGFLRPRGTLTGAYIKVCADGPREIEAWAREQTGASPEPCRRCRP